MINSSICCFESDDLKLTSIRRYNRLCVQYLIRCSPDQLLAKDLPVALHGFPADERHRLERH